MQKALIISLVTIFAGCSLLTGVDDSDYIEFDPEETCKTNNDCSSGTACPKLVNSLPSVDRFPETESHCYLDCSGNQSICGDTVEGNNSEPSYPLCFKYGNGAACLGQLNLTGRFSCPFVGQSEESELNLVLGNGDAISLNECEIWREQNQIDIILGTSSDIDWYQVVFHLGTQELRNDIDTSNSFGIATKSRVKLQDEDYTIQRTDVLGFFTKPNTKQPPFMKRQIEITNSITLANILDGEGVLKGTINFDGYAYEAQIPAAQ